jgi:leucyl aminopeptidase (aminopeptidase T)
MEARAMQPKQIARLLDTIVSPRKGERMLFLTDYPDGRPDAKRLGRAELLSRWHAAASMLSESTGFRLLPLVKYPETGKNNSDLPKTASTQGGGHVNDLPSLISSANIAIAMNEYSASAPLRNIAARSHNLRVVSMPGVTAEMEGAMSADYGKMDERGKKLQAIVAPAAGFEILFSGAGVPGGTRLYIDTRASNWILDSGMCRNRGDFINFPSGELFTPPYEGVSAEGRREFSDSRTSGTWPVYSFADGKVAFLKVEKNRIVRVQGNSKEAVKIIENIAQDENNANVAELGLGLNGNARSGESVPVLEKEKAGPHIAYGRNDHFGTPLTMAGKVTASVHIDYVYTRDTPITATIHAVYPNDKRVLIAERGKVVAV